MRVVKDIIELFIGFFVVPRLLMAILAFGLISLGVGQLYAFLVIPLVISGILAYFLLKYRIMIGYGLILYIVTRIINIFLPYALDSIGLVV